MSQEASSTTTPPRTLLRPTEHGDPLKPLAVSKSIAVKSNATGQGYRRKGCALAGFRGGAAFPGSFVASLTSWCFALTHLLVPGNAAVTSGGRRLPDDGGPVRLIGDLYCDERLSRIHFRGRGTGASTHGLVPAGLAEPPDLPG